MKKSATAQGFTLLELAIVILVIGFLIGSIFVGQDLIENSRLNATAAQIEKFQTALSTFDSKYQGLPGDILPATAGHYGLFQITGGTAGTVGMGNGNRLLETSIANTGSPYAQGEQLIFWRHLSESGLIDSAYGVVGNSTITPDTALPTADVTDVNASLPEAKIGRNNHFIAASTITGRMKNYLEIWPVKSINGGFYTNTGSVAGLTPVQMEFLDTKIDDGKPNMGRIIASDPHTFEAAPAWTTTPHSGSCITGGGTSVDPAVAYNITPAAGGTDPSCALVYFTQ